MSQTKPPQIAHGEAVMISAVVVGFATEGGKTPYRMAYAKLGASGHSVGVMQTDFGQNPALAKPYVDAVLADAAKRGVTFSAAERTQIDRTIVTKNPSWVDVPAKFKQAANTFGDSAAGAQWIHDNLDSRFLNIAVKHVEAFGSALDAKGIKLDPNTREETIAMVAKIANQAGEGRAGQLVDAVETGKFTGIRSATKGKSFDYPLPKDVPPNALGSAWVTGFAKSLERDGVLPVLSQGVGHARDYGTRYHKITETPGAATVLDRAEAKYTVKDLTPAAFSEKGDLAAIKQWVMNGRITQQQIETAQRAQGPSAPAAPAPAQPGPVARPTGGKRTEFDDLVEGAGTITSHFGPRRSPVAGASTLHKGVDVRAAVGDDLYAAAPGKVVRNFFDAKGGGNVLTMEHYKPDGSVLGYTQYLHMNKASPLKEGTWVDRGQIVGEAGKTGLPGMAPHLHYEEWKAHPGAKPLAIDGNNATVSVFRAQADAKNPVDNELGFALTAKERADKAALVKSGVSESDALRRLEGSSHAPIRQIVEGPARPAVAAALPPELARMNFAAQVPADLGKPATVPAELANKSFAVQVPEDLGMKVRPAVVGMNIEGRVFGERDGKTLVQTGANSLVSIPTEQLAGQAAVGDQVRVRTNADGTFAMDAAKAREQGNELQRAALSR